MYTDVSLGVFIILKAVHPHPTPPPGTHIFEAISSLALTRLDRLPSAIWSAALVPVGCYNDSFFSKKKQKTAQLFAHGLRMKSGEEEEERRMKVSPTLYCTAAISYNFTKPSQQKRKHVCHERLIGCC